MSSPVSFTNRHPVLRPAHRPQELLARRVFRGERKKGHAEVILAGTTILRGLNRHFRQKNKSTDVLSFPFGEPGSPDTSGFWGEIYIDLDILQTERRRAGSKLKDALAWRVVHGLLHLFGYDHYHDDSVATREKRYLQAAGFSVIDR